MYYRNQGKFIILLTESGELRYGFRQQNPILWSPVCIPMETREGLSSNPPSEQTLRPDTPKASSDSTVAVDEGVSVRRQVEEK